MSLPSILGGASALIGLLGKKKNYNASADLNAGRTDLASLKGIGSQYGALSGQAMADYGTDGGAYRDALTGEENYLKEDPYTDSRDAADLATATNGATQQFQQADANTSASLARRGLSDSSELGGALASNAGQKAAFFGSAQNALAYNKIKQRAANQSALVSLTGGVANQDYARGTSALGAEGSIDQNAAGTELNLGQREQGLEDASGNSIAAGLGAAGGAIGQEIGFGGGSLGSDPGVGGSSTAGLMAMLAKIKKQQGTGTPLVTVGGPGIGSASFNTFTPGG